MDKRLLSDRLATELSACCVAVALLISLVDMSCGPALANVNAAQIAAAMKATGSGKGVSTIDVLLLGDEAIISTECETAATDEMLRQQALKMSKSVAPGDVAGIKTMTFVFVDGTDHGRKLKIDPKEAGAGSGSVSAVEPVKRAGNSTAIMFSSSPQQVRSVPTYEADKSALLKRVNALSAKRVGVKPYMDQIARVDDLMKKGDLYEAASAMSYLDNVLDAQEQHFLPQPVAKTSAPAARPTASNVAPSQDFLSQFAGTNTGYDEEIAITILRRECGDLAPRRGAFRMERFRIAKAIQLLASKGTNVTGYVTLYRRIEALTAQTATAQSARDRGKFEQLTSDIQYLQQQLGLPQLQGTSHYHD